MVSGSAEVGRQCPGQRGKHGALADRVVRRRAAKHPEPLPHGPGKDPGVKADQSHGQQKVEPAQTAQIGVGFTEGWHRQTTGQQRRDDDDRQREHGRGEDPCSRHPGPPTELKLKHIGPHRSGDVLAKLPHEEDLGTAASADGLPQLVDQHLPAHRRTADRDRQDEEGRDPRSPRQVGNRGAHVTPVAHDRVCRGDEHQKEQHGSRDTQRSGSGHSKPRVGRVWGRSAGAGSITGLVWPTHPPGTAIGAQRRKLCLRHSPLLSLDRDRWGSTTLGSSRRGLKPPLQSSSTRPRASGVQSPNATAPGGRPASMLCRGSTPPSSPRQRSTTVPWPCPSFSRGFRC